MPLDLSNSILNGPIGSRVVAGRMFLSHLLHGLRLNALQGFVEQSHDGPLIVRLENYLGVAQPSDVLNQPEHRIAIGIYPFLGDGVSEDSFTPKILDHQDLEQRSLALTFLQLLPAHDAPFHDEEVVEGHYRDRISRSTETVLLSSAAAPDALFAPAAVRDVVDIVLIDLGLRRGSWVRRCPPGRSVQFGFVVVYLLDVPYSLSLLRVAEQLALLPRPVQRVLLLPHEDLARLLCTSASTAEVSAHFLQVTSLARSYGGLTHAFAPCRRKPFLKAGFRRLSFDT